jgi:hypothetical protein
VFPPPPPLPLGSWPLPGTLGPVLASAIASAIAYRALTPGRVARDGPWHGRHRSGLLPREVSITPLCSLIFFRFPLFLTAHTHAHSRRASATGGGPYPPGNVPAGQHRRADGAFARGLDMLHDRPHVPQRPRTLRCGLAQSSRSPCRYPL